MVVKFYVLKYGVPQTLFYSKSSILFHGTGLELLENDF